MNPTLTITGADGRPSRFAIGDRLVIGSSPAATVRRDEPWLAPEHVLVTPRGDSCWVSIADGGPVTATCGGKPFRSGYLAWGEVVELGSLEIVVSRGDKARSNPGAAETDDKEKQGTSPVLIMAVIGIAAWIVFANLGGAAATASVPGEIPALFDEPGPCDAANVEHRALQASDAARAKRERYVFEPQDGVEAVALFHEAAACHRRAGDERSAVAAEAAASALAERIEAEVQTRMLRLERALEHDDRALALDESYALVELLRHRPDSELAIGLRRLQFQLQSTGDEP